MKPIVAFVAGVVVGGIATYAALDRVAVPATVPPVTRAAAPPSAPSAAPRALPADVAVLAPALPSPVPGDSTDRYMDPSAFAPPPELRPDQAPTVSDFSRLRARALRLPVEGFDLHALRDNFAEARGGRVHEAIDLLAPRGTPILAVDDGVVRKLFTSAAGGLTVYEFDPNQDYAYYYAHLDRYAEGLAEGTALKKGDRVGYVGTTGNAPPGAPHLHFTIFKLGPEKRWWEGTPINPYPLWALR